MMFSHQNYTQETSKYNFFMGYIMNLVDTIPQLKNGSIVRNG